MKILSLAASGIMLVINMAYARDDESGYSQSYTVLIKGEAAGTETVTEKEGKPGEFISTSEHEIYVADLTGTKRMAFTTQMILSKATMIPISYNYRYTTGSGDSYEVSMNKGQVTRILNRSGRTSAVTVPFKPTMVIIDVNVYHQFDYLIRRYDAKKGGRQMFANFIPVNGADIPLAVTFIGDEKLKLGQAMVSVRNFRVEYVGVTWSGTISADENGRLVQLAVPAQDLQVIRKDFLSIN
jgi:hypothetical protein